MISQRNNNTSESDTLSYEATQSSCKDSPEKNSEAPTRFEASDFLSGLSLELFCVLHNCERSLPLVFLYPQYICARIQCITRQLLALSALPLCNTPIFLCHLSSKSWNKTTSTVKEWLILRNTVVLTPPFWEDAFVVGLGMSSFQTTRILELFPKLPFERSDRLFFFLFFLFLSFFP